MRLRDRNLTSEKILTCYRSDPAPKGRAAARPATPQARRHWVITGAVLAANGPDAIRIGVMLPRAAAYDFALAVIGMRMAAKIAESALPEMRQVALWTAT